MLDDSKQDSRESTIKINQNNLDSFQIDNIPNTLYYIPNFISTNEEQQILSSVYSAPKPKWTCLSNRRLQNWGGVPHNKGMIAEPIPLWLQKHIDSVQVVFPSAVKPNHVLVNEYTAGQGILAHTDGPLFHPVICTVSCGSHTMLNFHNKQETEIAYKILVERRSLLIVTRDLYHEHLHSISEICNDIVDDKVANISAVTLPVKKGDILQRNTRVSLTIRHVPSTTKFRLKLSK